MRKNRRLFVFIAALCLSLLISGCGGSQAAPPKGDSGAASAPAAAPAAPASAESAAPAPEEEAPGPEVDLSSESSLMEFMFGEWIFRGPESDRDYATLRVAQNGDCRFETLDGSRAFDGKLEFWPSPADENLLLSFELTADSVPEVPEAEAFGYYRPDGGESVSGDFHFARGDGMDYLYLRAIGNGSTYLSDAVLPETFDPDAAPGASCEWLLVRPHIDNLERRQEDADTFFGFVWGRKPSGELLVEKLLPHQYESVDEFTNRRLVAGYFTDEVDISVYALPVAPGLDCSRVQSLERFESAHPLRVYGMATDAQGAICGISELPALAYGEYEFGELDPEFSYDDFVFHYNGQDYELPEDADASVNAITDCTRVGDWIVVEGHVNPHIGAYCCFNIDSGRFEKTLYGANLTWRGSDLTTAVYSAYSEIYNWSGDLIGYVEDAEIMSLRFTNDGEAVEAECWRVENGKEVTVTETFELPPEGDDDAAMYRFADYTRRRTAARWDAFMALAPSEDTPLFVITNPPEEFADFLWNTMEIDPQTEDVLIAVALQDGTKLTMDEGEVLFEDDGLGWESGRELYSASLDRGEWLAFRVTLPEGAPSRSLLAETSSSSARFLIATLSGQWPQCSRFVSPEDLR